MSAFTYQSRSCFIPLRPNPNAPPNADHPTTMRPIFAGVLIPLLFIAGLAVSVRTAEAIRKDRRLKFDDYTSLLAFFVAIPTVALTIIYATTYRRDFDYPNCQPTASELLQCPIETRNSIVCFATPFWIKIIFSVNILGTTAQLSGRLSLCALYLRLFDSVQWLRYTVWSVIMLTTCNAIATFVVVGISTIPGRHEHWGTTVWHRYAAAVRFSVVFMSLRIFCDVLLVIVPMQPILTTRLPIQKKISTAAVFIVAIIATIATSISFYYIIIIAFKPNSHGPNQDVVDVEWKVGCKDLLLTVELCLIIIVSCVAGCVSAWRNVFRETVVYRRLRSWVICLTELVGLRKQQGTPTAIEFDEAAIKGNFGFIEVGNDDIERKRGSARSVDMEI